jgi:signal peptidase II
MYYLFMGLFAAVVVVADQLSKLWVVANIPLHTQTQVLPGLFHLTYVQNTGAAFSSFQGMIWLFILIFALFTGAIIWEFSKKTMPFTTFERWCIAAIYGGGLGNMIDRIRLGYVVDMIEVDFIRFPVFNVADCFITCGCILLLVHLVFFNKEFWKDEKKK